MPVPANDAPDAQGGAGVPADGAPNLNVVTVSIIRTVVPAAWGSLIAWLIALIPALDTIESQTEVLGQLLTLVVIGLWYTFSRSIESRLPKWLQAILFGSTAKPETYARDPEQGKRRSLGE